MLPRAACKKELRRRFIHPFCERQISNVDFSGSPAASAMSRTRVTHTPRPGEDVNLVLVLGILCLAIDGVDLHEHVCCYIVVFLRDSFTDLDTMFGFDRAR